eukprot:scaffold1970_cov396-Prasinococcus_capsulatus_cf.AAC.7
MYDTRKKRCAHDNAAGTFHCSRGGGTVHRREPLVDLAASSTQWRSVLTIIGMPCKALHYKCVAWFRVPAQRGRRVRAEVDSPTKRLACCSVKRMQDHPLAGVRCILRRHVLSKTETGDCRLGSRAARLSLPRLTKWAPALRR